MKKIVLLVDIFYFITAGAERQIVELCKNIDKDKYQITVACLSGHVNLLKEIEGYGAKTLRLGVHRIYGLRGIKRGFKFAKFLKSEKVDVLMTYHFGSDIFGAVFGKWAGVPLIISNRRDMGFWKKPSHVVLYKILDRLVNKIVVVSSGVRDAVMRSEKVAPEKITVIYNGINLERFEDKGDEAARHEALGIPSNAKVIACVGNIRLVKGHKYLIEAMKNVVEKFPETYLLLIGGFGMKEKSLTEELKAEADDLGIGGNVKFLGRRMDIPQILSSADICVLPSLSEGLSNTLLEYMAAEKPIVATDVGGNPEVIRDCESGLLVKPGDSADLADKLNYLLGNEDERARLGKAAHEDVINRFNIAKMLEHYEELFSGALERRSDKLIAEHEEIMQKRPAVVLGMSANGLSVARSLGRKGIPVIGVDNVNDGPAARSRYVKRFMTAPDTEGREELVSFLLSIAGGYSEKPVLLATADEYVSFVSANRDELFSGFDFLLSSPEIIERFLDKRKTSEFCEAQAIAHPKTFFLEHDEPLEKVLDAMKYPCIIKPQDSHIWRQYYDERKAFVVHSGKELKSVYSEVKQHQLNVVIQQIIEGADSDIYQFLAFCDKESKILASFCCRKLRQYPPHFGIACLCESSENPLILEAGKNILSKMSYHGMIALEFKIDQSSQTPVFLEANLRTSFFGELAVASGMDFPYLIYQNLVFDDRMVRPDNYVRGVKLWNIELDLGCLSRLRKSKEITIPEWLKGLKSKKIAHTYFAFDDWGPWCAVYGGFLKVVFSKIAGKVFGWFKRDKKITVKKKDINVLHLISSSGLFGAENVVLSLGKNIQGRKYHSIVGALHDPRRPEPEIIREAADLEIEEHAFKCYGRFDLGAVFRLRKYITKRDIDLLHTHNYKSDAVGFLASRLTGIPVIATAHGFTGMTRSVSLYERLDRWILRTFFERAIVVTNSMLKGFPKGKKRVIANGIDIVHLKRDGSKRNELRRLYHIGSGDIVIGTVGRLSYEKNQAMILEAAYPMMREDERIKVLIVGAGPKEAELRQFAAARHLEERILFTGLMRDTVSAYSAMDIFVLSSLTEGVPLTLLEAMAMELPVIATRVGGIPEIVSDGKNGFLVNSRDPDALRAQISALIADKEKALCLSGAARVFVKSNYSLEKMCREYKKVYGEVSKKERGDRKEMRILFIAPRLPVPADTGGKIRTLNILKQLASRARVHLVCFSFDPKDQEFSSALKKDGIEVTLVPVEELSFAQKVKRVLMDPEPVSVSKYYSDTMESILVELHQTNQFDAVHIDHLHMAHYRNCFDRLPCILDEHNVEYKILERCANVESSLLKRFIFKGQARKMKTFEAEQVKKFSAYCAVSDEDKDLLVELGADSACGHVIANGVDTQYFKKAEEGREKLEVEEEAVVFTGSMDWLPNDDAALYFCKDILPLVWKENPNVKFYIVGKGASSALQECARSDSRIIVTGRVDDVRIYVEKSKVFVVPLRIGGGTRLKILEAMSMRKAVVSTSIGAEGIACRDGHDIVMADTPEDFARKVLSLLGAPSSLERIGSAGRALVMEQYDWNIIGKALSKVYERYKA